MPIVLQDTFTAANGTALDGRTLEVGGVTWTKYLRGSDFMSADIQSDRARLLHGGSGSNGCYAAEAGVSDETVSVDLEATAGDTVPSIVGRLSDANNWWSCDIFTTGNVVRIVKCQAGSVTLEASESVTVANNTTYAMTTTWLGTAIGATVEGVTTSTTSSFNQTATKFGIGSLNGAANQTAFFDNFQVGTADATYTPLRAAKLNDQGPRFVNNILRRGL